MRRRLLILMVIAVLGSALASSGERRCSLCGTVIAEHEKYYQVTGGKEVFCQRCFREAPRCSVCKLPAAEADIDPETGACSRCLAKLPRCKACGKPIVGSYFKFPSSRGVFCAECKNNRHACDICGVPVGDDYWQYPDGRIICSDCGDRAILDAATIRSIVRYVQECVDRRLGLKLKRPYTVVVETLSGTAAPARNRLVKPPGGDGALYGKELGMYLFGNGRSEIILLFGMPPELVYETAAHEYAHAWQAENGLADIAPELLEGFAQWVAAEVLRDKGFKGALERLEARTDYPYGTGYQRLKSLQQKIILQILQQRR